jgi:hypothetical protein
MGANYRKNVASGLFLLCALHLQRSGGPPAMNVAFRLAYSFTWIDQLIVQPLMIAFAMIMDQVGIQRGTSASHFI